LVSVISIIVSRDKLLRDGQENVVIAVGGDPSWTDCIEVSVTVVVERGNDGQEVVPVLAELPSRETSSKSGLAVSKPPKSETPIYYWFPRTSRGPGFSMSVGSSI
jgi:hypothetical protein